VPFFTRPDLSDIQFKQISGSSLNLSGSTRIADSGSLIVDGDLVLDGKEIVASGVTGVDVFAGDVLTLDVDGKIKLMPSGSGGTGFYNGASPSNITVGGIPAGTTLTGKTYDDLFEELLITYLVPTFTAMGVSGQATTVEVGAGLSGSRTFTWTTSNAGNVQPNSVAIRNVTTNTLLGSGLANDGSEVLGITTNPMSVNYTTQVWRAEATNTNLAAFNSSNFTVVANYRRFFGASGLSPLNSAQVRALPTTNFQTASVNTFTLNTGNALTKYVVALPPSRTITSVIDIDALNANITTSYILTGTISVLDNGGVGPATHLYNIYEMNTGVPYSTNHQHVITTV
jgi:hypothetical protein